MANVKLIVTIIIVILAIVITGISVALDGVLSLSKDPPLKTTLLAAAATGGFSVIFAIAAAIVAIMLANASKAGLPARKRALLITFIVLVSIALILYITDIALNLVARNNIDMTPSNKTTVTAAIIMMAVGFIVMIIATILVYQISRQATLLKMTKTSTVTTATTKTK